MNLHDAYLTLQKESGIKVGDTVKVLRRADDFEGGWNYRWDSSKDKFVGLTGKVISIKGRDGIRVRFPDDEEWWEGWYFPWFVLQKALPLLSPAEVYLIGQRESGIKVGDRVRLLRVAEDHEAGWDNSWISDMTGHVGETGEITYIKGNVGVCVKFPRGIEYHYPFFVLQKVARHVFSITEDGELICTPFLRKEEIDDPLSLSIEKWRTIADYLEEHPGVQVRDGGIFTCAMCVVYNTNHDCIECPIRKFTGKSGCEGTPYKMFVKSNFQSVVAARAEEWFLRVLQEHLDA